MTQSVWCDLLVDASACDRRLARFLHRVAAQRNVARLAREQIGRWPVLFPVRAQFLQQPLGRPVRRLVGCL